MQYSNLGGQAQNVPFFLAAVILDVKFLEDGYDLF